MITGNATWNQRVAAMTTKERPLYTFEIPDEGLIITSFIPAEANVTMDIANLAPQPLWSQAGLRLAGMKSVALDPTTGFVIVGADGTALAVPPDASVERFDWGPSITGTTAYLGWNGISYPPGMQAVSRAASLDLVVAGTLTDTAGYFPTATVGYSVIAGPASTATWFTALSSAVPGPLSTTFRLWPGNSDVGPNLPDINNVQIKVSLEGATVGSAPLGCVFSLSAALLVEFP